jgi:hypothetical protein
MIILDENLTKSRSSPFKHQEGAVRAEISARRVRRLAIDKGGARRARAFASPKAAMTAKLAQCCARNLR